MNRSSSTYFPSASNATIVGVVPRFAFSGKEKDFETGLSYFGARYYDADLTTGWLSVDPMADKYPSTSPYAYCVWNPVKLVDPDGRDVEIVKDDKRKTIIVRANFYYNSKEMGGQSTTFIAGFKAVLSAWGNDMKEALKDESLGVQGYSFSFEYLCIDSNNPQADAESDISGIGNYISHAEGKRSEVCVVNSRNLQIDFNFKRSNDNGDVDEWFYNIEHGTLKHEIGHLFGLRDRYESAINPAPYIKGDLMSTDPDRGNAVEPFKRVWRAANLHKGVTFALINNSNRESKE